MNSLTGKTAIITGAGRGIGRSIAVNLAKAGANTVLVSRTLSQLKETESLLNEFGVKTLCLDVDISEEKQVIKLKSKVLEEFENVDILVNNAGVGYFSNVVDTDLNQYDEMFNVNMRGLFLMIKSFLPKMIEQNSGDIINVASLAGKNAVAGGAVYAATKWAVIGFSKSLMLEVRKYNIRVIAICPGSVSTTFSDRLRTSTKLPTPDTIADIVLFTLQMPKNVMVSEIDVRPTIPE